MKYSSTLGWIPLITRCFTWSVHYGFVSLQYLFACTHRAVSAAAKQFGKLTEIWRISSNLYHLSETKMWHSNAGVVGAVWSRGCRFVCSSQRRISHQTFFFLVEILRICWVMQGSVAGKLSEIAEWRSSGSDAELCIVLRKAVMGRKKGEFCFNASTKCSCLMSNPAPAAQSMAWETTEVVLLTVARSSLSHLQQMENRSTLKNQSWTQWGSTHSRKTDWGIFHKAEAQSMLSDPTWAFLGD